MECEIANQKILHLLVLGLVIELFEDEKENEDD
jgi:hypothetical protein